MIAFIDDHRADHGVEPICAVLPIASSTYHAQAARRADPAKLPARSQRDIALKLEINRVHAENFRIYGVRKVWHQFKREGHDGSTQNGRLTPTLSPPGNSGRFNPPTNPGGSKTSLRVIHFRRRLVGNVALGYIDPSQESRRQLQLCCSRNFDSAAL